ncbi:MAG TPA: hypothetical protein GXZ27_07515 [Thermoanaerobacterales bacterium]|jgi:hypothetical protein|nr:hypothetical protein [Thermoanaerobacterales bacterium]
MSIPESGMEKVGLVWPCLSAILIAEIVTACVNSLNGAILFFLILFLSYFHAAFYYMQNIPNLYPVMIWIPLLRVTSLAMPIWQVPITDDEIKCVRLVVTISLIIMIFIKELADTAHRYNHDMVSSQISLDNYIDIVIIPSLCVFIFIFISRLQVALN